MQMSYSIKRLIYIADPPHKCLMHQSQEKLYLATQDKAIANLLLLL